MKMKNTEEKGKDVQENDEEGNQKRSNLVVIKIRYTLKYW